MNGSHKQNRWPRKLIVLILLGVIGMYFLSFTAKRPTKLGVKNGQLSPLSESPNGVSTQSTRPGQQMAPIPYTGTDSKEMEKIVKAVNSMPRSKITEQDSHYMRAEFTSLIFRFVDDVEFFIDDEDKVIQFRSASRVGYSDLGANRRRMNLLCEKIKQ